MENAWAFYDLANSSYPLVITSAILPIYYGSVAKHSTRIIDGKEVDYVQFFGAEFINTELYSYAFSFSFLIVALISPILSGIADYSAAKKKFLKFFCYLGGLSCMSMIFFSMDRFELSMLSVILASVGFWGSLVFYNAFLPEIAPPKEHDRVSAKGFAMGYVGSVVLLILNLIAIQAFDMNPKYAFFTVGIWWIGFAQVTYYFLPEGSIKKSHNGNILTKGYQELNKVWKEFMGIKRLKRYLTAYFVFSMGVQTVMLMAAVFGDREINWPEGDRSGMLISILIIQLIASVGAYFFAWLSKKTHNLFVLRIIIFIWVFICMVAYFITEPVEFYSLAAGVGFVMGGVQSMARSTYSKMLPETKDHASYFSFFDVLEKIGIVLGTFLFGFIQGITGSMRDSVVSVVVFFILGFILLQFVPRIKKAVSS